MRTCAFLRCVPALARLVPLTAPLGAAVLLSAPVGSAVLIACGGSQGDGAGPQGGAEGGGGDGTAAPDARAGDDAFAPDGGTDGAQDLLDGGPVDGSTTASPDGRSAAASAADGSSNAQDGSGVPADSGSSAATPGARSGLPWMSGSNGDPTMEAKYYDAFGQWRGRPDDIAMMYTDRSSWAKVTGADMFVFQYMKTWPGKLVISQPPFPQDGSSNLNDCASGSYDHYWKDFGSALVSNGRPDTIVRIAWEFNGDFMYWHATNDTAQFIQCWNHVASAIKSTDPQAIADWTINSKSTPGDSCMGDATNCYPGDQYVDSIGIDNYDEYPPSTTTSFDTIANAKGGLSWIYAFAAKHHKRFGVGEWGVVSSQGSNGGGDNPAFVANMWAWFQAHTSLGLYEAYFGTNLSGEVDSKIVDNTTGSCGCDNPMASAKYKVLWHP